MNLITSGPDYTATQVKLKIIHRRERMVVYVPSDGRVLMTTVKENEQRANPYPDEWLIGLYGKGATTDQIRDDLECRLTEIRVVRPAPTRKWSNEEEFELEERYADEKTADIAADMGRTLNSVEGKARIMGLRKSAEFLRSPDSGRIHGSKAA